MPSRVIWWNIFTFYRIEFSPKTHWTNVTASCCDPHRRWQRRIQDLNVKKILFAKPSWYSILANDLCYLFIDLRYSDGTLIYGRHCIYSAQTKYDRMLDNGFNLTFSFRLFVTRKKHFSVFFRTGNSMLSHNNTFKRVKRQEID